MALSAIAELLRADEDCAAIGDTDKVGCVSGLATGRSVWQFSNPLRGQPGLAASGGFRFWFFGNGYCLLLALLADQTHRSLI